MKGVSHSEITAKLRYCAQHFSCDGCPGECYVSSKEPRTAFVSNEAADAIEELLAAVPHWISVEEQLPKKKVGDEGYVGYLVLSGGEYQIADFTHDKYMQSAYEFHVDGEYDPNVTHWMELPPKEVE